MEEDAAKFILEKLKTEGIIRPKTRTSRRRSSKNCSHELVSNTTTLARRDYFMGAEAWKDTSIIMNDATVSSAPGRRNSAPVNRPAGDMLMKGEIYVSPTPTIIPKQQQESGPNDVMDLDKERTARTTRQQKRRLSPVTLNVY